MSWRGCDCGSAADGSTRNRRGGRRVGLLARLEVGVDGVAVNFRWFRFDGWIGELIPMGAEPLIGCANEFLTRLRREGGVPRQIEINIWMKEKK